MLEALFPVLNPVAEVMVLPFAAIANIARVKGNTVSINESDDDDDAGFFFKRVGFLSVGGGVLGI